MEALVACAKFTSGFLHPVTGFIVTWGKLGLMGLDARGGGKGAFSELGRIYYRLTIAGDFGMSKITRWCSDPSQVGNAMS